MCGTKLKRCFLGLGLLLLPLFSSFSEEIVYEITEAELTQLENNMERLRTLNDELQSSLERAESELKNSTEELLGLRVTTGRLRMRLNRAEEELARAQNSLMKAQASFAEYETETRKRNVRNVIVSVLGGFLAGGAVGALFL